MKFLSYLFTALLSLSSRQYVAAENIPASIEWTEPVTSEVTAFKADSDSDDDKFAEQGPTHLWKGNYRISLSRKSLTEPSKRNEENVSQLILKLEEIVAFWNLFRTPNNLEVAVIPETFRQKITDAHSEINIDCKPLNPNNGGKISLTFNVESESPCLRELQKACSISRRTELPKHVTQKKYAMYGWTGWWTNNIPFEWEYEVFTEIEGLALGSDEPIPSSDQVGEEINMIEKQVHHENTKIIKGFVNVLTTQRSNANEILSIEFFPAQGTRSCDFPQITSDRLAADILGHLKNAKFGAQANVQTRGQPLISDEYDIAKNMKQFEVDGGEFGTLVRFIHIDHSASLDSNPFSKLIECLQANEKIRKETEKIKKAKYNFTKALKQDERAAKISKQSMSDQSSSENFSFREYFKQKNGWTLRL